MRIITKDSGGLENGWLMPIWNATESPEERPEQVYVTTVLPGFRKGPHLHMRRRGRFSCIEGKVWVRRRFENGTYSTVRLNPETPHLLISPGIPVAIYNLGDVPAVLLNLPAPAWTAAEPDDWPVTDWLDPIGWEPTK